MVSPVVRPVVVSAADPTWSTRGRALAEQVLAALGADADRVDHIGSTSIPGMAAKHLYDLQVSVADLAVADGFDDRLVPLGYLRSSYDRDHVPAGRTDDPDLWRKRLWTRRGHPDGEVNLHVRQVGSPNERVALLFRDWFRAHPAAVPAYARFKELLAAQVPDSGVYSDIKDPVVDLVISLAEEWAVATGWQIRPQ